MDPFEDLIRVSALPRVRARPSPLHRGTWIEMRLRLSAHHIILDEGGGGGGGELGEGQEIKILHRNIDSIERRSSSSSSSSASTVAPSTAGVRSGSFDAVFHLPMSTSSPSHNPAASGNGGGSSSSSNTNSNVLHIRCKDLRVVSVEFPRPQEMADVAESLEKLAAIDDVARSYPFFFRPSFKSLEDGWTSFEPEVEFSKLLRKDKEWRLSTVNRDFSVCRSYPQAVIVPASITDDHLRASAAFRHGGRFPVLSYRHTTGKVIVRTSQPLCGPQFRRCREDERMFAAILGKDRRGFIIDTRTQATSHSEKAKGGGYELEDYYPHWRRINKSIDRYYYLLDSYSKLMEACMDVGASCDKWLSRVTISSWLTHIKEILNCGCLIAQVLDKENASVVVHGSEGVDVTLCVTSLAQVILDPDCRTVRGFEALVEREWLQAGHPFWSRTTRGPFSDSVAAKSRSHAPTFNIFLDCVRQIHTQFPRSFEFTEGFLLTLSDHAYASQFGTFLCDCVCERRRLGLSERTTSLWSNLNRPEELERHLNCLYEPNRGITWPSVAPVSLTLWIGKYLRFVVDQSPQRLAAERAREIVERNRSARAAAARLRKRLAEALEEAEALGLVTDEHDEEGEEVKVCGGAVQNGGGGKNSAEEDGDQDICH